MVSSLRSSLVRCEKACTRRQRSSEHSSFSVIAVALAFARGDANQPYLFVCRSRSFVRNFRARIWITLSVKLSQCQVEHLGCVASQSLYCSTCASATISTILRSWYARYLRSNGIILRGVFWPMNGHLAHPQYHVI